jgi:cytochrome c-type biogenesis protein CcmF
MAAGGGSMVVGSVLELTDGTRSETVTPLAMYESNSAPVYRPVPSSLLNANVQVVAMHVGMGSGTSSITVGVQRPGETALQPETLVVDASIKPFINLLWGGTLLLMVGLTLSIVKRSKEA